MLEGRARLLQSQAPVFSIAQVVRVGDMRLLKVLIETELQVAMELEELEVTTPEQRMLEQAQMEFVLLRQNQQPLQLQERIL